MLLTGFSGYSKAIKPQPYFVQNLGQVTDQYGNIRRDIDFKLQAAPGLNLFLGAGALLYQWYYSDTGDKLDGTMCYGQISMYRMDVFLVGANVNAPVTTESPINSSKLFYSSQNAKKGTLAKGVTTVTYHNIYPNIDWVLYINKDGKLEHDFIIHPNGRVSDIRIAYAGNNSLALAEDGSIEAATAFGTIRDAAPFAYEKASDRKVPCRYNLRGNELSYFTGSYSGTLVIDPVVEWSTYFGGTDYDDISALVHANDGDFYIAGNTSSAANIATTGSFQFTFGGGSGLTGADAFIAKFSAEGTCLWSTYYGGSGTDLGKGIAIDTSGNIYLSGRTNSPTGIATTGSHQSVKAGTPSGYDCFLAKFDTAGQRIWATYYGGSAQDGSSQVTVACDKENGVFLAGNTASMDQISTTGSYQSTLGGSQDAFIAKFSTEGALAWSSYFGGTGLDVFQSAVCDESGNILLAGYSSSPGLASTGSYQQVNGGAEDALLVKFNGQGQLQWSTYMGGTEQDRALSISAINDAIFIGGITSSPTAIASVGAYQPALGDASGDGFLARFNTAGQRLWSTYYGGSQNDIISGVSAAIDGKIYVGGTTASSTGIATANSIDTSLTGIYNCIVSCFDTAGNIVWGSYFGTLSDEGSAISVSENKITLAGKTTSSTGIGTPGAHQNTIGGDQDGFLVQFNTCELPTAIDTVIGGRNICAGDTLILQALSTSGSYQWLLPAGWSQISGGDTLMAIVGSVSAPVKVIPVNDCSAGDTVIVDISVAPAPIPVINRSGNILATTQPFPSYQWNLNGTAITGATNPTLVAAENGSYTVTVTNTGGCDGTSSPVIITDLTAMDHKQERNLLPIYPNPASSLMHLELPCKAELHISDNLGRIIHKQRLGAGKRSMDLKEFSAGVYMIIAYDQTGKLIGSCKLVKE